MQKGIKCLKCHSLSVILNERKCVCQKCGYAELMSRAVLRSIKEFKVLFPNEKITTNIIHDWCKVVKSKRRIRNVLRSNFDNVGVRQWTYYE